MSGTTEDSSPLEPLSQTTHVHATRAQKREAPRERVVRHIKELIDKRFVLEGERLPSERALATQLKVSRDTVNAALSLLMNQGLIHSNGGRLRIVSVSAQEAAFDAESGVEWMQETVVVVTPHVEVASGHRAPGWIEFIAQGALKAVEEHGHAFLLNSRRLDFKRFEGVLRMRPQGLLLVGVSNETEKEAAWIERALQLTRRCGVPCVTSGNGPSVQSVDRVVSDHEAGSYELTRWMLARNRRRPLLVWPDPAHGYWFEPRRQGYERAMREAGLAPLPPVLIPAFRADFVAASKDEFERLSRHQLGYLAEHLTGAQAVDALLAASDGPVPSLAAACRLLNLEPNRDVLLGGYDNYWMDAPERAFEPCAPLVTVDKNNEHIGGAMVRLLRERIEGTVLPEPQRRLLAPQLLVTS